MYVTKHESMSVRLVPFIRCLAAGAALCICAAAGSARAAVYNIYSDFSSSSDPSGAWTYGYEPQSMAPLPPTPLSNSMGVPNIGSTTLSGPADFRTSDMAAWSGILQVRLRCKPETIARQIVTTTPTSACCALRRQAPAHTAPTSTLPVSAPVPTRRITSTSMEPRCSSRRSKSGHRHLFQWLAHPDRGRNRRYYRFERRREQHEPRRYDLVGVTAVLQSPPADVPEPASLALLGVAVVWMTAVRRRIRQAI